MSQIWISATVLGQAAIKVQTKGSSHEFSVAFDNSCGAFGNEYKRNNFALFNNLTGEIEDEEYGIDAERFLERLASYLGYKVEKPEDAIEE